LPGGQKFVMLLRNYVALVESLSVGHAVGHLGQSRFDELGHPRRELAAAPSVATGRERVDAGRVTGGDADNAKSGRVDERDCMM
jgi:hypothetical protein